MNPEPYTLTLEPQALRSFARFERLELMDLGFRALGLYRVLGLWEFQFRVFGVSVTIWVLYEILRGFREFCGLGFRVHVWHFERLGPLN